jgi:hypothetical protein
MKKPISHSLPNSRSKESPGKPSVAARYKLLNDDEDEKWEQIEKDKVVNRHNKGRRMSMNKAVTEGLTKDEASTDKATF